MASTACWFLFIAVLVISEVHGLFEFTNINCVSTDKSFGEFEYCFLKAVNRTYKYMSMKLTMFKLPVTNCKVHAKVMKKGHSFSPHIALNSIDACEFMRMRNNPVANFLHGLYEPYSNINHTCPYNHDLIIDKLPASYVETSFSKAFIQLPAGDYVTTANWYVDGEERAKVVVHGRYSEKKQEETKPTKRKI